MASFMHGNVDNALLELENNKNKYSVAQNDLVVGLGRPMYGTSMSNTRKKAYPAMISTLGKMDPYVRRWIATHNFMVQDYTQANAFKSMFLAEIAGKGKAKSKIELPEDKRAQIATMTNNLLEMYPLGVALGQAWAHPHSGDTVASVMVGGLRTILNGAFQVHTGDLLMFYFDDEAELFEENGGRKDRSMLLENNSPKLEMDRVVDYIVKGQLSAPANPMPGKMNTATQNRFQYHEKENANFLRTPNGRVEGKQNVFRVKPYVESRYPDKYSAGLHAIVPQHFPCDKARIFARAISNARPFDFLDIQLSRQAI